MCKPIWLFKLVGRFGNLHCVKIELAAQQRYIKTAILKHFGKFLGKHRRWGPVLIKFRNEGLQLFQHGTQQRIYSFSVSFWMYSCLLYFIKHVKAML